MRTKVRMMRVNVTRLPSIFLHSSLMKWRHSSKNMHDVETRRSLTLEVGVEAISVQIGAASSTGTIPHDALRSWKGGTGKLGLGGRTVHRFGIHSHVETSRCDGSNDIHQERVLIPVKRLFCGTPHMDDDSTKEQVVDSDHFTVCTGLSRALGSSTDSQSIACIY